jgi:hypothetical protein
MLSVILPFVVAPLRRFVDLTLITRSENEGDLATEEFRFQHFSFKTFFSFSDQTQFLFDSCSVWKARGLVKYKRDA